MKTLRLITFLITLTYMIFPACATDQTKGRNTDRDDHVLVKLWADYNKAVDDDRPKDQADILQRIKQEASAQRLAWDYYDAVWKYVEARTSTNWKLRQELNTAAEREIAAFDEPVMLFYHRNGRMDRSELFAYVQEHKSRLESGRHPEFYDRDGNLDGLQYGNFLLPRITNDYDYALWSLFGSSGGQVVSQTLAERYARQYPYDALIEYTTHNKNLSGSKYYEFCEDYARRYAGKAVALLAREDILMNRQRQLDGQKAGSDQYKELAADCERFVADRKKFTGDEKDIAECCTYVDRILGELYEQEINLDAEKGVAKIVVRNLPSVRVRIYKGKRELFDQTVPNPVGSFYVHDTLTFKLPVLDDGEYVLKCTGGKVETESVYNRFTLAIAHKRDLDGYGVYVADYLTGEPVQRCDIVLLDQEGKELDRVKDLAIDGFTYLPAAFCAKLDKD